MGRDVDSRLESRRLDGPAAPRRRQDRAANRCGAWNSSDGRHHVDQNVPGARCSAGDASKSQDRALRHRNLPTDLYMAKGLIDSLARGHVLKTVAPEAVEDTIDESVAALMLTHIDYGSGRVHNMARLTEKAHAAGALAIWDLA